METLGQEDMQLFFFRPLLLHQFGTFSSVLEFATHPSNVIVLCLHRNIWTAR